jgi:hypothetical protein
MAAALSLRLLTASTVVMNKRAVRSEQKNSACQFNTRMPV